MATITRPAWNNLGERARGRVRVRARVRVRVRVRVGLGVITCGRACVS